jgi:predicted lipoprotein with Yx(FWY)xxD motif
MSRSLPALLTLAALVVAGCGNNGAAAGGASRGATVDAAKIDGGTVLVDSSGAALYTPAGGADCTGACAKVWIPLAAGTSAPTKGDGVPGSLDSTARADGTRQVTYNGKPLYRFAEDKSGQVTGDGASDAFGGMSFTWHVIRTKGGAAKQKPSGGGYSY